MSDPTHEQTAILTAAVDSKDNLLINALAGTGKTTTLEMIERAVRKMPILYLVFNHRNAKEATARMLPTTTVRTMNALGHRIWGQAVRRDLVVDPKKCQSIMRGLIDQSPRDIRQEMWDSFWPVVQGVAMAKAVGYVPEGKFAQAKRLTNQGDFHATLEEEPDDLTSDLIDAVLSESIRQAYQGKIDYNDQVYMPAVFSAPFPRYPLGLLDEVQDFSPVNHAIVEKLFGPGGRLIAVGDRWQNIYAFRGAKHGGMDALAVRFQTKPHDLSISFRCPRAVVEAARWRVPQFKWMKEGGHVEHLRRVQANDIADGSAIICRNNAPLLRTAMFALSSGRSVQVVGSDIGPKLTGIMRRLGPESWRRVESIGAIDGWLAEREAKGSGTAADLAACMKVFVNLTANLGQAIAYAEHLFKQTGRLQFLTGHKAKGLEFHTVYHLDPWLCREDEQDLNLRYVITTRSADTLYEVDSQDIVW